MNMGKNSMSIAIIYDIIIIIIIINNILDNIIKHIRQRHHSSEKKGDNHPGVTMTA